MALQKDMELENNFGEKSFIKNCYIKVEAVRVSKARCFATVAIFKEDKDWRLVSNEIAFDGDFSESSSNNIRQAYVYIKTLPEYSNAIDV
jgi:hypothetical protein